MPDFIGPLAFLNNVMDALTVGESVANVAQAGEDDDDQNDKQVKKAKKEAYLDGLNERKDLIDSRKEAMKKRRASMNSDGHTHSQSRRR